MIDNLYKRSLVDEVYVALKINVKQPFEKRGLKVDQSILSKPIRTQGTTQDFLNTIIGYNKICIVGIDYAGITTNMSGLKKLLT
ncbi:unnamed protein product [Rhizopus stolonifer]